MTHSLSLDKHFPLERKTQVRERTISFMVYKLNMLKDMLPKLVLRKDLTPKLRCDLITTCYCVVSAFVEMHKKFEDLKLIAKSKGSPPGNISTLKSEFPPRGSKELKILWRSQLLEHYLRRGEIQVECLRTTAL